MAAKEKKAKAPLPPLKTWLPCVALAWFVPGGGHLLLRRRGRGFLLLSAVALTFLMGLMMRGVMFRPQTGDLLTTIIYCGGFLGDMASGVFYFFSVWMGYAQPDVAGHAHDYGTKFLVTAGLMNVLAMVDAFEIAVGRKQ